MALENLSEKYLDLNKLVIGFLSILIPISSTLAGCMTYQFLNYLNTKSFIQTEVEKKISSQCHPALPHHHDYYRSSELGKSQLTEEKNGDMLEPRRRTANRIVPQLGQSNFETLTPLQKDPANESLNLNETRPNPMNSKLQRDESNWLSSSDIANSTTARGGRQAFFEPVYHLLNFFDDKLNVIVSTLWISTLLGVGFEILTFKSLAQHTLIDSGLTKVYGWPLLILVILNFLISTGTRIYFARLASTMLRSPKSFLIFSLILFFMSLAGTIFQLILAGKHLSNYDEIANISSLDDDGPRGITYSIFFHLIGIDKVSLDLLQIVWLGPSFLWELLISIVLLVNGLHTKKRCRFGAVDGKCSLAILLLFE